MKFIFFKGYENIINTFFFKKLLLSLNWILDHYKKKKKEVLKVCHSLIFDLSFCLINVLLSFSAEAGAPFS